MSIELPRDADGREIPLDTVVPFSRSGESHNIVRWIYTTDFETWTEPSMWRAIDENNRAIEPEPLYLTAPDSREKLLDDSDRATDKGYSPYCTYFGKKGSRDSCRAKAHKEQMSRCGTAALYDIASRIRKLRGGGDAQLLPLLRETAFQLR